MKVITWSLIGAWMVVCAWVVYGLGWSFGDLGFWGFLILSLLFGATVASLTKNR